MAKCKRILPCKRLGAILVPIFSNLVSQRTAPKWLNLCKNGRIGEIAGRGTASNGVLEMLIFYIAMKGKELSRTFYKSSLPRIKVSRLVDCDPASGIEGFQVPIV